MKGTDLHVIITKHNMYALLDLYIANISFVHEDDYDLLRTSPLIHVDSLCSSAGIVFWVVPVI